MDQPLFVDAIQTLRNEIESMWDDINESFTEIDNEVVTSINRYNNNKSFQSISLNHDQDSQNKKNIVFPKYMDSFILQQHSNKSLLLNINKNSGTWGYNRIFESMSNLSITKYDYNDDKLTNKSIELSIRSQKHKVVSNETSFRYHDYYYSDASRCDTRDIKADKLKVNGILYCPQNENHILQQKKCIGSIIKSICNVINVSNDLISIIAVFTVYLSTDIIYIFIENDKRHNLTQRSRCHEINVVQMYPNECNCEILETIPIQISLTPHHRCATDTTTFIDISSGRFLEYKFCDNEGFHFVYKNNPFLVIGWSVSSFDIGNTFGIFEFDMINNSFISHKEYFEYATPSESTVECGNRVSSQAIYYFRNKHTKNFDSLFVKNINDGRRQSSEWGCGEQHYFYFDVDVANDINQQYMVIIHFFIQEFHKIDFIDLYILDKAKCCFIGCDKNIEMPFQSINTVKNAYMVQINKYIHFCVKGYDVISWIIDML
eukprot:74244_1